MEDMDYMGDYLGALGGSALPNGPVTSAVHNSDMGGFFDFLTPNKNKGSTSHQTKSVLSKGSKGPAVTELQELMKSKGAFPHTVDGDFGSDTENAVKVYQRSQGLPDTGVVNAQTWASLLGEDYVDPAAQSAKQAQTAQTIQTATSAISDLISQFAVPPANAQEIMQAPVYEPAPPAGFPWKWVVGGLAGVVVLGGVAYYMTRD